MNKLIVYRDRKPSIQMLNLFAFKDSDDEGSKSCEIKRGHNQSIADELYHRCYPNWKWRNVKNSRDSGIDKFPITNQDFNTLKVPFSTYIYYNSSDDKGSTEINAEHAIHMLKVIEEINSFDCARMSDSFVSAYLEINCEAERMLSNLEYFRDLDYVEKVCDVSEWDTCT